MMSTSYPRLLIILIGLAIVQSLHAQTAPIPQAQQERMAQRELEKSGVDEGILKLRLLEKGIDLDNMSPEQLLANQGEIERTIAEIKAEQESSKKELQANEAAQEVVEESIELADDVKDAVNDGATVEEARSEAEIAASREANTDAPSRIYGHQIFENKTLDVYRATEQAKAPANYILDSGDELAISIFGASQTDLILEIGTDGFIKPSGIPRIYLKGRSLKEARKLVKSRLKGYYVFNDGQFSMSVDAARTISVGIYGEVQQSGTYTLSALNGPLNALVAAGGPTDKGSVRNIELIRDGKSIRIDIYAFLQAPSQSSTIQLQEKDIINVPLANELVRISGGVRRPMIYELTPNETLSKAIEYAGGTTVKAALSATRVERYSNGVIEILDLNENDYKYFDPKNGDKVDIPVIEQPIEDFVSIKGEILIPGRFGYRKDLSIMQLLERSKIKPSARRDVAFIQRNNNDGTKKLIRISLEEKSADLSQLLKRGDELTILAASRFVSDAQFTVRGAIRDIEVTFPYPQDGKLTLEEAILLSGGLQENATKEALIIRTPLENRDERKYIRVKIAEANNVTIQPSDEIILYTKERFTDAPKVSISGAVRNPVETRWANSLDINDLIYLAGGISYEASKERVEVYRLELANNKTRTLVESLSLNDEGMVESDFELQPFDEVYVRSLAGFEQIESVSIEGEILYPGAYARLEGKNRVSDFIKRAGGLTEEAFIGGATLIRKDNGTIILDLKKILEDTSAPNNMVLRAGDRILIPKPLEVVSIYINNTYADQFGINSLKKGGQIKVTYQGKHKANWYINQYAGGFTKNAERKATTVTGPAGGIQETKSFLGIRKYPKVLAGSTVYTPTKPPKREKPDRERTSWSEISQVIVAAMTTVATLIIISK